MRAAGIEIPGQRCEDFLPIINGSAVLLNPASDFGKQFAPAEIAALLDGSIFAPHSSRTTTQAEEVFLGQPADYPTHVTDALAKYFRRRSDVRAAYLALFANPATGDPPHTLIGVDTTGPWKEVAGEAGIVLAGVCRPDEVVDFIQIDDSGVSDYLRGTKPFYKKKILGLF
ncbi:MAG: enhanced serine sensitivity protein SseB C-terminal domain-containing protein [Deltaproteobacteria bacterium]|nr:enhanced serine sensitivity protein SseB C-terminal domain-containing protein [Deltaproteobacteria bacterium]